MKPRTLADIPPDVHGTPYRIWRVQRPVCTPEELQAYRAEQSRIATEVEAALDGRRDKRKGRHVSDAPIATSRDSYGWRSLPPSGRRA